MCRRRGCSALGLQQKEISCSIQREVAVSKNAGNMRVKTNKSNKRKSEKTKKTQKDTRASQSPPTFRRARGQCNIRGLLVIVTVFSGRLSERLDMLLLLLPLQYERLLAAFGVAAVQPMLMVCVCVCLFMLFWTTGGVAN